MTVPSTGRALATAFASILLAASSPTRPAAASQGAQAAEFDLASLFVLTPRGGDGGDGSLLLDENDDGVPDRLGVAFVLPAEPSGAERMAAAEIAARLGFETMALDLPVARGVGPGARIAVGRRAVAEAGLTWEAFGAPEPGPGEGAVATLAVGGTRWLAVAGGGDDGLLRAARTLAGALPGVGSLSGPSLGEIGAEIVEWLEGAPGRATFRWTVADVDGNLRLGARLELPVPADADSAFHRLERLAAARTGPESTAAEADSVALRFAGVSSVALSIGGREVVLPTLASPPPPGPIPGRPGSGAKTEMDLSNVYSNDGFLADSDGNEAPDRIDVLLVPDTDARGTVDLAARLGLESTGLTVPLLKRPEEIESPAGEPTTVLLGTAEAHPWIARLADSGRISLDDLTPGQGLIELVPRAFDDKPSVVVTGADRAGATWATRQLAEAFPYTPTFDQIERDLWGALSGRTPAGQAAIGLYKLDQIAASLADEGIVRAEVLVSLEKPGGGTSGDGYAALVRERAGALGADSVVVTIDDRDVQAAGTIFEDAFEVPSEADRFWAVFEERVEGAAAPGQPVRMEVRLSEPPEIRQAVAQEARRRLVEAGADPDATQVQVLSAFKQGFSWLRESVGARLADGGEGAQPDRIEIEFLRNEPPAQWPQQAIHTPLRWLHEIFPIDEVLARDLGMDPGQVRFEMVDSGPVYRVRALASDGRPLLEDTFEPKWVLRPYFDRFRDYEQVRVTTGWITAVAGDGAQADTLADQRIVTDPEWFWDRFQSHTLPAVYDYVMDRHDGNPRGGAADAPFFGTLTVELEMSEPDYRLDVDNEIVSPMDALHEEVYFGTIEFFHLLGRNARGQDLTYPGRIVPVMRPKATGAGPEAGRPTPDAERAHIASASGPGHGRIHLTGFATSRPAVVVRYETQDGRKGERRLDIPRIEMERPSLRRAVLTPTADAARSGPPADTARTPDAARAPDDARTPDNARMPDDARTPDDASNRVPALSRLDFRVRVDSEMDERDALLQLARPEQVDERMISAQQVAATVANLSALREAGVHAGVLAYPHIGEIGVWAEWTHEQDPESRTTAVLPANGVPEPPPVWSDLLPVEWTWDDARIVQWDTPIPPDEGHEMLAKMSAAFEHATMYQVGESYLGRTTWAADLMPPVAATHWSRAKATTFKPTVVYSARQHANEVSSTSHVLRHAELLLTDSAQRRKLNKVNVVVHPFTNPDGAQLAYDLYRITPDFILHAGYLGSLGMDVTSGSGQDFPLYPEANVRPRLWDMWLPDIFLNPHGYPSHQVVQLFSEYSGLVRRGRVTERNWGLNKGWFMPGFGYVDDPEFPRHKDAAFKIREYITRAINANRDVFEMNQRNYDRYRRYGAAFDPEVFRLPMTDSVLIEMPLKGSRGGGEGRGFNPKVTIWSGITEAPDETAYGPWMELVAKAGLSWDQAILDYLYDGAHRVERTGSRFFGGTTLKMTRERPPKPES